MARPFDQAHMRGIDRGRGLSPTAADPPGEAQKTVFLVGATASEYLREERAPRALHQTKEATRLLERAFVSLVEENELSMPAVERLYAALEEAEASVAALEARRPRSRQRGEPRK